MNFIIYSKLNCPFCVKIKQVLDLLVKNSSESSVKILELDEDFSREAFIEKFGKNSTFPQVIMDGLHLGGCTDTIQYLKSNNLINLSK